jgi:predicted ATPase/DNA-binding winged helix-turn-helix (wHTH) protein
MTDLASSLEITFSFGQFQLQPARRVLLDNGQPVRLGNRALDLLILLTERAGQVLSKEELIARVWPSTVVDEAGLRVHIAALRKLLGESRSGLRYIANVPLRGYCFVAPVTRSAPLAPHAGDESAAPARPAYLPPLLTRVIGRQDEVVSVMATVSARRLVTLVGPGGIGKTTVAVAAAERLRPQYPDGVRFVDLASLADPELLPSAVAAAFELRLGAEPPAVAVTQWLAGKGVLLLLDNCEHVIDAAALFIEQLLSGAPGVHVLATSREPLRARAEWVLRLNSLLAPPADAEITYAQALEYSAFELFVERAMASADGLVFADADVAPIALLCRKLDGIPLAIELVSARIRVFGLQGLIAKLDGRLALPTQGHRTAMPRHQTLRTTLDWSHDLLSSEEQALLRRLSVLRERFSLESALAVAGGSAADTTEALMNLVAKSLVAADPGEAAVHYRLLETTRSYAAERLEASGEQAEVARRHALHCLDLLKLSAAELERDLPARWRERNSHRIDDIRAALNWTFGPQGDPELGARIAAESAPLWYGLWLVNEYLSRTEQAIARLPAADIGGRLDMRLALAFGEASTAIRGCTPESLAAAARCLTIARQLNDSYHQTGALWLNFGGHALLGDYRAALEATEDFGNVARDSGDAMAVFMYHRMKALCLHLLGRQIEALSHAQRALHPSTVGIRQLQINPYQFDHRTAALTQLARILWLHGCPDQAMRAAENAVATAKAVDHALSLTYALAYAACPVALWRGDTERAQVHARELLECTRSNSLLFWESWGQLYRQVLQDPAAPREGSFNAGHLDMLATLRADAADARVLQRADAGLNAWCAAEVLRVMGERALAEDADAEAGERLLRRALSLAQDQGAHAWALRAATSLAHALQASGRAAEGKQLLLAALAPITEGFGTRDVAVAMALVERL